MTAKIKFHKKIAKSQNDEFAVIHSQSNTHVI